VNNNEKRYPLFEQCRMKSSERAQVVRCTCRAYVVVFGSSGFEYLSKDNLEMEVI
jgi:hypothetical protein